MSLILESNRVGTLTGVPGVGKGYYQEQLKLRGEIPEGLRITSTGTELLKFVNTKREKEELPPITRDHLKFLKQEDMDEGFDGAIATILSMVPVLLDSHVVTHREGTELGSQRNFHLKIRAERFIHVVGDPRLIAEQRAADGSRQRAVETPDQIDRHQTMSLEETRRIADELKADMIEIKNTHSREKDEENIRIIRDQLNKLMRRND